MSPIPPISKFSTKPPIRNSTTSVGFRPRIQGPEPTGTSHRNVRTGTGQRIENLDQSGLNDPSKPELGSRIRGYIPRKISLEFKMTKQSIDLVIFSDSDLDQIF